METNASFSQWIAMNYGREVYSSMISISENSCLSGRQRLEKFLWEIIQTENNCDTTKAV